MIETLKHIAHEKRTTLAGVGASILIWWVFIGRHKYSTVGLRRYS